MASTLDQLEPLTDPRAIRALAHPARLAILDRLRLGGPATATECAGVAGLSASACSYHLRSLAKYGFVREAPSRGDGRERVWEASGRQLSVNVGPDESAASLDAVNMLVTTTLAASDRQVQAWVTASAHEPQAWADASTVTNTDIRCTVEEMREIVEQVFGVLQPYWDRGRAAADAPEGSRLVHLALRVVPRVEESAGPAAGPA